MPALGRRHRLHEDVAGAAHCLWVNRQTVPVPCGARISHREIWNPPAGGRPAPAPESPSLALCQPTFPSWDSGVSSLTFPQQVPRRAGRGSRGTFSAGSRDVDSEMYRGVRD